MQFPSLTVKNLIINPPLFLAPMAGVTHCAFRRLISDFGGYGALYTEMLSAKALVRENLKESPFTKRRECEGSVIYQLLISGDEDFEKIAGLLEVHGVFGIDINLGCPAPEVVRINAGIALFNDMPRMQKTLEKVRSAWKGLLFVKCRFGKQEEGWEKGFAERIKLFEDLGMDAVVLHPRFMKEKLKRLARWELFPWVASLTSLPIIANGDISHATDIEAHPDWFNPVKGLMIGRMAAVKPWIFTEFSGQKVSIDYLEVWQRLYRYVNEDFPPEKAIGRIKEFTAYFARNFFFGHNFFSAVNSSQSLEALHDRALAFLSSNPQLALNPSTASNI
jgi:tRNA-dihydrouridine synthase B